MQEAELPTETLISIIDDDEDFREAIARRTSKETITEHQEDQETS
jgi:hypothetical protein